MFKKQDRKQFRSWLPLDSLDSEFGKRRDKRMSLGLTVEQFCAQFDALRRRASGQNQNDGKSCVTRQQRREKNGQLNTRQLKLSSDHAC